MAHRKTVKTLAAGAFGLAFGGLVATAAAADPTPGVVFDMGGKFDRSFNEGVYNGVERFATETGITYREFEVTNETQREQAIRRMARSGANPVLGVGFAQAGSIAKVAAEYPDTDFVLIDGVVEAPNVRSVLFKEQEGSFLVGVLAAMHTQTDTVGFIGGMDIPLIRRFACGYEQGVKWVNADADVLHNMTGTTPAAWNDPTKGGELARSQFDRGVDVVFAAAGGTGIGVYQAAVDAGKYAIGVDSNQNHLHPGTMLTSMMKRVDVAAYKAFDDAINGTFTAGTEVLGLAEDGVDWAFDENNESLITDEMKTKVEEAKAGIVAGDIAVHDYMTDNSCTY